METLDPHDDITSALRRLARQEQFLEVVSREEAVARVHRHLALAPLANETLPLARALGRVLAHAAIAEADVPRFDRASVDGFALRASDTTAARARGPRTRTPHPEILTPGVQPLIS